MGLGHGRRGGAAAAAGGGGVGVGVALQLKLDVHRRQVATSHVPSQMIPGAVVEIDRSVMVFPLHEVVVLMLRAAAAEPVALCRHRKLVPGIGMACEDRVQGG